ncbi:sensor histidine kinase [Roseomonas sp. PWR1]|uniref:histidine kinase n=1 Tax=Roseomonas nitratireducens TaxID=2820810 RepID=A0ABS4AX89_9PROT|nr:sensor histidine kinase [Neoroseomonas nitratireducens]MBP0465192.1 sensor histidine kinase [Neoroseomonas nitratireducens]
MRPPRSLALRLGLAAGLWVAAGLGAASWFVTGIALRQVEAAFDARHEGLLDAAVAATALDAAGRIVVARAPAGADFERPFSGAYWQVTASDGAVATSRSLWDQALAPASAGHAGVLLRDTPGPRGERLRLAERDVMLPGAAAPAHVAVALSRGATEAEIARLRTVLLAAFAVLGIGLVGGVVATVVAGLAPLRRIRRALAEVRAGTRERLALDAPSELAPLVSEVDALIAGNRATVERARTHVGNLAHALKTPLAVLRNALEGGAPDVAAARAQAAALERLVHHHLARARTAARVAASAAPTVAPLAVAEEVASALRRLLGERGIVIAVAGDAAARLRVDPQDLTEMLGNLMENACKWARRRVEVSVAMADGVVVIGVGDDGPGLAAEQREAALRRGTRLDEAIPGTGLGLAIVADLAEIHGGVLELGPSAAGGLAATLRLPVLARGADG